MTQRRKKEERTPIGKECKKQHQTLDLNYGDTALGVGDLDTESLSLGDDFDALA